MDIDGARTEDVSGNVAAQGSSQVDWRKNKRTRKVQSCIPCHKRKIKCDRTRPQCHNCVKKGERDACMWESPDEEHDALAPNERHQLMSRIRELESTLVRLRRGDNNVETSSAEPRSSPPESSSRPSSCIASRSHPLLAYAPDDFFDDPKAFPFSSLWEGDSSTVLLDLLPDKDSTDRLVAIFLDHLDSYHPVYSRTDFLPLYEEFSALSEEQRPAYPPSMLALLFSVFALGMLLSGGDERARKLPFEVLEGETVTQARQRAARATAGVFASAAWHALRAASFLGSPTVHTVAALSWLEDYLVYEDRPKDAWTLHGVAFKSSMLLLQQPGAPTAKERLWRYHIHQESRLALVFGLPGMALSTIYPRPAYPPLDAPFASDLFGQYEQLFWQETLIMERIVAHCTHPLQPSEITAIDQDMGVWKARLPPQLDTDSPSFDLGAGMWAQAVKLAFDYHNMRLVLHCGYHERYAEGSQGYTHSMDISADALHQLAHCWLEVYDLSPETLRAQGWAGYGGITTCLQSCAWALRHRGHPRSAQLADDARRIAGALRNIKATNQPATKGLPVVEAQLAALARQR